MRIVDPVEPSQAFASTYRRDWRVFGEGRELLEGACGRPELRPLLTGMTIRTDERVRAPFVVPRSDLVEVHPVAASSDVALRVHLRHALELAMWRRIAVPWLPSAQIGSAVLAAVTAVRYLDTFPDEERSAAIAASGWLATLREWFSVADGRDVGQTGIEQLIERSRLVLPLQGSSATIANDAELEADAARFVTRLLPLASPTERLLTLGGDGRLTVDPNSRLNKYGCCTTPRPSAITFSSCTASSTSEIGYAEAERCRQRLIAAAARGDTLERGCSAMADEIRRELSATLGLVPQDGAEVVLAASGTDCELFALYVALAGHRDNLISIVIGPDEIGSGSLPAAHGRHYDASAPLNNDVIPGEPLAGFPSERVRVATIALRDRHGYPVRLDDIDAAVSSLAVAAAGRNARVLLHLVDSSKTGLRAPSLETARRLKRELGDRLVLLIDAAQMRTWTGTLLELVADGGLVMVSGSKFYTGCPFSGALIVPAAHAAQLDGADEVPTGLGDYFCRSDIPSRWRHVRAALPEAVNLGLLLRWQTALAEIRAFNRIPESARRTWYSGFRSAALEGLITYGLLPVDAPVGERLFTPTDGEWDTRPTIFTFFVPRREPDGTRTLMDLAEATRLYHLLNRDASSCLPAWATAKDLEVAAKPCHVGQPVRMRAPGGDLKGALRVAVGARYASRVAFDGSLGPDPVSRMASQFADLEHTFRKIAVLAHHWPEITGELSSSPA